MQLITPDEINSLTKTCSKCGKNKRLIDFGVNKVCRYGVNPKCKSCSKDASSAWYALNKERVAKYQAAYRALNIDKVKVYRAAYYVANAEKIKASAVAWGSANPEKVKEHGTKWITENKDKVRANTQAWRIENKEQSRLHVQNRRARQRENGGALSKDIAIKLFKLQRGLCPCCKLPLGENYHIDHIMPVSKGGANTDDNVQLLRQRCNTQKNAKHPVDFMQQRGFLL